MKLKIKDRSIYTEEAQQAINDFENDVLRKYSESIEDDEDRAMVANNAVLMIEAIDSFINLIKSDNDRTDKSFQMCGLSLIGSMCQSQHEQYISEIPSMLKDMLQDMLNNM